MKCIHCGQEVPDNSKYCNKCGKVIQEDLEKNTNLLQKDYLSFRTFIIEHKPWVLGFVAWVVINLILLLFGGYGADIHYTHKTAKEVFFPFAGKAENYDFTEFFVYVIAVPIMVYIAYYLIKKRKIKVRIPELSLKTILYGLLIAIPFSLFIYAVALKPVEHYKARTTAGGTIVYYMDIAKAEIPSFLGDTYHYNPYKHIFKYNHYPLISSHELVSKNPPMPLMYRLRLALIILLSWKGLRFIILMWLLMYVILGSFVPSIRTLLHKEANLNETQNR